MYRYLLFRRDGDGMIPVEQGDKVKVLYEGTFDDGTVFDSSEKHGGEPLEFVCGTGQVIPGFDNAILGMEKGEEKTVRLEPCDAYGDPDPSMIKAFPKDKFETDEKLEEGMLLLMNLPNGQQISAKIVKCTDDMITFDLNHPMAGKTLNFKLKVVDYGPPDS